MQPQINPALLQQLLQARQAATAPPPEMQPDAMEGELPVGAPQQGLASGEEQVKVVIPTANIMQAMAAQRAAALQPPVR